MIYQLILTLHMLCLKYVPFRFGNILPRILSRKIAPEFEQFLKILKIYQKKLCILIHMSIHS